MTSPDPISSMDPSDPVDPPAPVDASASDRDGPPAEATPAEATPNEAASAEATPAQTPADPPPRIEPDDRAAAPVEVAGKDEPLEAEPVSPAIPDPLLSELQERVKLGARKVEQALAALDRNAARVSASSGGTRFSTLQRSQGALAWELRDWRGRVPDETVLAGLDGLLEKAERLVAALAPPERPDDHQSAGVEVGFPATDPAEVPATAASTVPATAPASAGAVRQALIRGMITLAPAPLHLQIEFAAGFPFAQADPIALAARSHAVNRAVLGSLRRIQWEAPDRCSLWFGDGEQRRIVAAAFDQQGKVDVPPEYRQKQNPGGERRPAAAAGAQERGPGRHRHRGGAPGDAQGGRPGQPGRGAQPARPASAEGSAESLPGQGDPGQRRARHRHRPQERQGPRPDQPGSGQPGSGQPADGRSAGGQSPGGHRRHGSPRGEPPRGGQPQSPGPRSGAPRPGQGRPGSRPEQRGGGPEQRSEQRSEQRGGKPRDERSARPSGRGGGFPANSTMADKLRAALAPAKAAAAPPVRPPAQPSAPADSSPGEPASSSAADNSRNDQG